MVAQAHVDGVLLVPDLRVPGIEVKVHSPPRFRQQPPQPAELIHEEVDIGGQSLDLAAGQADVPRPIALEEARMVVKGEPIDDVAEVLSVRAGEERRSLAFGVDRVSGASSST